MLARLCWSVLGGSGGSVSRLIMWMIRVTVWFIGVSNLLTYKVPLTLQP